MNHFNKFLLLSRDIHEARRYADANGLLPYQWSMAGYPLRQLKPDQHWVALILDGFQDNPKYSIIMQQVETARDRGAVHSISHG